MATTNPINKSHYQKKVADLISRIEKIIAEGSDKVQQSKQIMEEIRKEYILLPLEYVNSFLYTREELEEITKIPFSLEPKSEFNEEQLKETRRVYEEVVAQVLSQRRYYNKATIDPNKIVDEGYICDKVAVWGNSFGPFNPEKYFSSPFKILWLLKESYVTKSSWIGGDRGCHNQAEEYVRYFKQNKKFDNSTHDNLLRLSQLLLSTITDINLCNRNLYSNSTLKKIEKLRQERLADFENVFAHICILEVNHFPGLAFNSSDTNDDLLSIWTKNNKDLIQTLIDFYSPDLVVGCQSVLWHYTSSPDLLNWISDKENLNFSFIFTENRRNRNYFLKINEVPVKKLAYVRNYQ